MFLLELSKDEFKEMITSTVQEALKETTTPNEEFLTRPESAALLRITLPTFDKWRRDGKIKTYGIEGRVLFKRSEIEQAPEEIKYQ